MVNEHRALLIIDLQNAVFDGKQIPPAYAAERLLDNAGALLHAARRSGVPIIHVQHCAPAGEALEEGGPGWPICAPVAPDAGEPVVRKRFASAFEATELHAVLEKLGVRSLIVTGIQSEHCVAATCRAALELGYSVCLAEDAHSTWPTGDRSAEEIVAEQNHTLNAGGVALRHTEDLIRAIRGGRAADGGA
jgi:nicotinamidase-related amidase